MKIKYLLIADGGTGGSNSVFYDVCEMRSLGVDAVILCPDFVRESMVSNYGDSPSFHTVFTFYDSLSTEQLRTELEDASHVVATIWTSVELINASTCAPPNGPKRLYFVQDYEPLFYPPESNEFRRAFDTYRAGFKMFAKSSRLIRIVAEFHNQSVELVQPGISTQSFFPNIRNNAERCGSVVGIMTRPATPYRNSDGLFAMLRQIEPHTLFEVFSFGCTDEQLLIAKGDLRSVVRNFGVLKPHEVPYMLRQCDIFVDISYHQGFGRLGLEAAACGCALVNTDVSGLTDILIDAEHCFFVSPHNPDMLEEVVKRLLQDADTRAQVGLRGAAKAACYSTRASSLSALSVIASA